MKGATAILAASFAFAACATSGPPPLSPAEQQVRSVTDASYCEYITGAQTTAFHSDMTLQEAVKRETYEQGGDSFKILHTQDKHSDMFGRITEAEIEVYRCRN